MLSDERKPRIGIVFYSRSGTGRAVADRLATSSGWPLHEIRDAVPRMGLSGDLRCVADRLLGRRPSVRYAGPSLDIYDHVILITPVWLRGLASPMRAFLDTQRRMIRAYSVICVMSGHGGFRAVDDIATQIGARPRSILLLRQHDVLAGETDGAVCRFKRQILAAAGPASPIEPLLPAVD
ncbi:flavodoxin family protein [Achromobacter sp. 413638]|uniref:flavodoxin family protein n=1 Tax=Achromobacter sp. 413638 TaxID=3342385 RepID=UPI003253F295